MKTTVHMLRVLVLLALLLSYGRAQAQVNTGGGSVSLPTTLSAPGVFTNAQMNENYVVNVGSGANCSPSGIFAFWNASNFLTDALTGVACVPASGATNDWSNAVSGFALDNAASSTCGALGTGPCKAVAINGLAVSTHAGAPVWGANLLSVTSTGQAAQLFGVEIDIAPSNTGDTGFGLFISDSGGAQPSGTWNGVDLSTLGSSKWNNGYVCDSGAIATNCMVVGAATTGAKQNSQTLLFQANDLNSAAFSTGIQLNTSRILSIAAMPVMITSVPAGNTDPGGFGIALKSTAAALSQNQLVKIDTANNDSIVVCVTTDTSCTGFVGSQTNAGFWCALASSTCPIITVPGSLAKGILGTGTCSRGNFVIVDTTTNGDIKCTASQPAQGAWIGTALSAQSTVGQTVDVLTKFQ